MSLERVLLTLFYSVWLLLVFLLQGVILYLLLRHSPKSFQTFRFLLAESAVFQLLALSCTYFTLLGLETDVQPIIVNSYGLCRFCAPKVCFTTYLFTLMFVWLSSTAIFSTFYFKYISFVSVIISPSHIFKFILIGHSPAMILFILELWMYYELSPTFPSVQHADISEFSQVSLLPTTSKSYAATFFLMSISSLVFPFICWYFRRRTLQELNIRMTRISMTKRENHALFVTGLTIQIMVPIVVYPVAFAIFYYCTYQGAKLPLPDLSSFLTVGIPALTDPIVSLYFVTPFRKVLKSWLSKTSSQVVPVSKTF